MIKIKGDKIRIGILFSNRSDAEGKYSSYKRDSIKRYFIATLEVHDDFLNLALTNSNEDLIEYHNLIYSVKEVMQLRMQMRPNAEILFAHIYKCSIRGLIAVSAKWRSQFIKINYHHVVIVKKMS